MNSKGSCARAFPILKCAIKKLKNPKKSTFLFRIRRRRERSQIKAVLTPSSKLQSPSSELYPIKRYMHLNFVWYHFAIPPPPFKFQNDAPREPFEFMDWEFCFQARGGQAFNLHHSLFWADCEQRSWFFPFLFTFLLRTSVGAPIRFLHFL